MLTIWRRDQISSRITTGQICLLPTPHSWMDWLLPDAQQGRPLRAAPAGTLDVTTLRKDGVALIPQPDS